MQIQIKRDAVLPGGRVSALKVQKVLSKMFSGLYDSSFHTQKSCIFQQIRGEDCQDTDHVVFCMS